MPLRHTRRPARPRSKHRRRCPFLRTHPPKSPLALADRIPLGRITLLVSDPGLGKSLLALDIAARVSRGAPWPDEAKDEGGVGKGESSDDLPPSSFRLPPSSVLLLTAEDDFADTVRPRLEALGA